MATCWLLISYLKGYLMLLNIDYKITDNIVSNSRAIAHKRPIPVGAILCDCPFIDHKKTFP
jgi:hypothetical protein